MHVSGRMPRVFGAALIGYLVGTFPTADLVARSASGGSVDLRNSGTGNPGGANALKLLGKKAGATVIIGDIAKGALASGFAAVVAGPIGAHVGGTSSVIVSSRTGARPA